jgi:hypothetical protein
MNKMLTQSAFLFGPVRILIKDGLTLAFYLKHVI